MVLSTLRFALISLLLIAFASAVTAQRPRPKPRATPLPEVPAEDEQKPNEPKEVDVLKTETDLVTVPVIATDRGGLYIADLVKDDLAITEDGVAQQIAFFAQTSAPFHVILMLDTSASTREQLPLIQKAAYAFVEQLQSEDRVKIISFDDQVRDLGDFTNDRNLLNAAINRTVSGQGTKVYDAMAMALASFGKIQGRKAIVIFTDGVDWFSDDATFKSTVRWLDEEGVIVYPIRYNTREAAERLAREQLNEISPQLPTSDVLRPVPGGTTPTTFPSDNPIPTSGTRPKTGPLGLPTADEIWRRTRQPDPNRDPSADPGRDPSGQPDRDSRRRPPGTHDPEDLPRGGTTTRLPREEDSIGARLDAAYSTADSYLKTLAERTGGQLMRADTLRSLPDAFAKVASELRTQYSIGYYPLNKDRDDRYRKIKVSTKRKDVVIRARPGYLRSEAN
ncbi:MAG TPA: VWA domain-containing protein [Pyrinomonadaceae bacterium]|nr:VWA domain-containing protein [Pyrinomonadaceae bacterium]